MNISFPTIKNILPVRKTNVSFKGNGYECRPDTFEKSELIKVLHFNHEITGKKVKDIKLKTKDGQEENGFILQDSSKPEQYFACVKGETHCRIVFYDKDDKIYISELYGERNEGKYKGAGTELLKFAVEQSMKRGYKGKLYLKAGGSFPFYYKNNFRTTEEKDDAEENALFDYLSRIKSPNTGKWYHIKSNPNMMLNEEGAAALLKNKRLYTESKSETLFELPFRINGETKIADVDFYDGGDKYVIQVMDKKSWTDVQLGYLTGEIKDGKLLPGEIIENGKDEPEKEICEIVERGRIKAEEKYNKEQALLT